MHVCVLTGGRYPPDERTRREASALRQGGHSVTVCARGAAGEPTHDIVEGVDVRRLPDDDLYSGVGGLLDGVRYALRYVHPAWVRAATEIDDERSVDVCCVRDPSLVRTGAAVGGALDVPVVLDLADATLDRTGSTGGLRGLARRLFHSSRRRDRLVAGGFADADHVVTTCEEARAASVRDGGLDPGRVAVVHDSVSSVELDPEHELGLGFDPETAFVVTAFVEGCARRDLDALIDAAARAAGDVPDLRLLLVGDPGRETLDALETLARRRLAGGRVTFRTDATHSECVAASDVCVFPPTRDAATTLPVELFEAMALGVPAVTADGTPARRLVTSANAGLVRSPADLATALVDLAAPGVATRLGANGRRALDDAFDPATDAARLLAVYETLAADVT